mgnify:CR=1 FL=1
MISLPQRLDQARSNAGFTLIELLIVVAIVGILAAVGIPSYNGYIADAKETTAQNNLRSIYLMQQDYYSENHSYCTGSTCSSATKINTVLFGGKKTLSENTDNPYKYSVSRVGSGYKAFARKKSGDTLREFSINQNNSLVTL